MPAAAEAPPSLWSHLRGGGFAISPLCRLACSIAGIGAPSNDQRVPAAHVAAARALWLYGLAISWS
jgi:hypothetical protein